jgi:hypothetical protein
MAMTKSTQIKISRQNLIKGILGRNFATILGHCDLRIVIDGVRLKGSVWINRIGLSD